MANSESDKVLEFLHGIQLDQFYRRIHDELHVTRLNHFAHVKEQDLDDLGLSKPEQRRLFEALKKSKKKLLFGSFRRKKSKTKLFSSEPDNEEPSRPSLASVFKPVTPPSPPLPSTSLTCVIDEKKLVLHEMLGTGAFGYVRKGEWITDKNKKVDVAVKCLKISKDCAFLQLQLDFTKEANGMSRLDHPHIIKLYGVVLSTPIMLVTEIAPLGCLLTCLRDENPKFLISQLCELVVQVASGMAYLEAEHYIHRDLAARNLLLSSFDTVKIGDFGLTRPLGTEEDYYTMNPKGKVPFAWCPPESLKFRKFSHASDMWSFGILLMELFSYGEEPWPGLNCTQILQKVDMPNAERPQKPSHCPSKIYNVVLNHCWAHDPAHRPTFAAIQNIMEQIRPEDVKAKHSFDSETPQNLPFVEGDAVTLIEASPDANWWRGQNKRTGRVGMFPSEMVDRPSGSPSPTIIRSASIAKKVSKSPVPCTPGKQNCDCGEDHLYDLPFIINSPNTASSPTRSQDSDFTCSTESGYSSSLSQSISESNRRDSSANYENCISTPNYELMEPTVKIKPTRPAPTPYEESKDLGSSNSPPVTIPERKDSLQEKRLSDSSLEQVAKKRSDKPRSTGPFTLSRRVSSKKLKSFDIPIKRRDSSSPVNSSSTNTDRNSMPSLSANQSPSSSRPNSRNSIGSMSPDRSPVLRPKSEISEQSPSKVSPRARSFARSCSSGGFSSKSLRDAQQRIKSPSPTDMYSKDDINFKGSSSDGFSSKSLRDAQQSIKSPSPMDTTDDISFKGRSYSFGSPSQRGCQRTELYEKHEYIPRCHTVSGTSTYDNHKLNRSPNRDTFYENHEIVNTYNKAQNLVNSRSNIEEGLGSNTYDNHRLQSQPASERSQGSSVPQGYEKMVLRKSYFEKEPNAFDAKPKNTSYENYSVGSIRNSQVPYENFVIVEHSDVPEEIRTTLNNLKCPSYENQGFEELRAQAENDLIKESDILDNVFQDYSCSLPNSENWGVVKKTLDNNGSLVIKMGRSITPRLRKSSSDGDLRDEEDINLDLGSASSGCKETRPARCSLDITGELASALSNRMNIKENVTITNNGVKFAEALMETFKSRKELEGSSLQDRDLGNSSEPAQTVESFKNSQEFHESSQKGKVLGNTNESVQFDPSLNNERVGIPFNDVPPPLPERKKRSSSRVANEDFISNSYENVNKDVTVPQRNEPIPNKETLQNEVIEDKTTDIEDTHSSPPRPNVLCFENRLAAFMSPKLIKKVNVEDDVPDLPPKARSLPRSQKSTSNYPRLSRDSSDVKLTFADDVNRYRPCPTKASPNYEYPRRSGNEGDETPPPLPKKHSKTSPDVPVRPDMSCN